ncbi:UDP-N-acetyl-D-mannosamine dehydrogenase [BD1-7 clade bacterium]|uniref:UDP-N-acetyl-D-mannosamine dehydrogenase n=1 Tax=BD1-7 clade bacterium TaxID=2029982 RepID=A0A5S9QS48_9GAMM|nr:UDP-N-acetyl-D-mannosamine dehydrogenase [BD1-7 clade bacterium]CAA0121506.1 UDP-N-acetyl-D-mannosamine dehydrogenase [BD1-7 clade bacterium]
MSFETISVVGLGYIGLPTAAMFASRKIKVIGVDVNQHAVDTINKGEIHIVEPDLDMLVHAAVTEGYLKATTTPEKADAFLIAVPTPFKENHEPDLSYIEAASKAIAPVLEKGNLVILESTSPVGATEDMAKWIAEARPDLNVPLNECDDGDIYVAHCPERVLPGHVVRELVENDRVIGGINARSSDKAVELYRCFVLGECVITNARTAEMAKLTENASRDVSIAFANELSLICDELDIDVWELIKLANRHPRVNILQPGPGVGGHCIAVDPWFIINKTPEQAPLIHAARRVNDGKPGWVVEKVKEEIQRFLNDHPEKDVNGVTVACFGLAFKPDIDDLRESPALDIVEDLTADLECNIIAVEPNVKRIEGNVKLVALDDALASADIYVLLVDHKVFKQFKPACAYVIDMKGIWG